MFSAASALRNKEARVAGYIWALSQPFLSDFTEEVSDEAMLQWIYDTNAPLNGDLAYYWELGQMWT
jgi:hypothetical protein